MNASRKTPKFMLYWGQFQSAQNRMNWSQFAYGDDWDALCKIQNESTLPGEWKIEDWETGKVMDRSSGFAMR